MLAPFAIGLAVGLIVGVFTMALLMMAAKEAAMD